MTGEVLDSGPGPATPTSHTTCNPNGSGRTTFDAEGVAIGPYPGTFTVSGVVTFSSGLINLGSAYGRAITGMTESFTINSGVNSIVGTKGPGASGVVEFVSTASCNPSGPQPNVFVQGDTTYDATIMTPTADFQDQGSSTFQTIAGPNIAATSQFRELFTSIIGPPTTVVLSPATATNPVGTDHTVTATVSDAFGRPDPSTTVDFTVTGSDDTTGTCTTDVNGQCSFTYHGPVLPGQDAITACAGPSGAPPCGAATKTWVLPVSTPGCEVNITNGGWIVAPDGAHGSLGGNAKIAADGTLSGDEQYTDHGAASIDVHSINILAIVCHNNFEFADIYGQATINGTGAHNFRIEVTDPDSLSGPDTYGITLDSGYTTGDQPLGGGNVEIHTSS